MKKFVTGPPDRNGVQKTVNLENVSNIAFEIYTDRYKEEKHKIIFNFNYGISLKMDYSKIIPDYQYFIYDDKEDYDKMVDVLNELTNNNGWLAPMHQNVVPRIINPNSISFLSLDPSKNRIIVNINTSVSFYNNNERKSSDFLFLDFSSEEEYLSEYKYMMSQLDMVTM